jgi:hypothetical protein
MHQVLSMAVAGVNSNIVACCVALNFDMGTCHWMATTAPVLLLLKLVPLLLETSYSSLLPTNSMHSTGTILSAVGSPAAGPVAGSAEAGQ